MRTPMLNRGATAALVAAVAVAGCGGTNTDKAGGARGVKLTVLTMANGNGHPGELEPFAAAAERLSGGTLRIEFKNAWRAGTPDYENGLIDDVKVGQGRSRLGGLPRVRQRRGTVVRRVARAAAHRQLSA